MGISHVCVDRGRLLIKEPSAARVEGRTTFVPIPGPWFKCRLFYEGGPSEQDAQQAHWKTVPQPQLLTVLHAEDQSRLVFHADYRVHVRSGQLGDLLWRMAGEPEPLRKKRRIIGWLATVERVIERQYDDLLHQDMPNAISLNPGVPI